MKPQELKIGVLGGGQLGRMLINSAIDYGVDLHILDPDPDAPCSNICKNFTLGDFNDFDTVYNFGKELSVITIEIEKVNTKALKQLQSEGVKIIPDPEIIEIIQDKGLQKEFLEKHNIPTAAFQLVENITEAKQAPFVQKLRRDGYDGRGVKLIRNDEDLNHALEGASVIEDLVDIKNELAIIVARNSQGETKVYDPVEMKMDPELNLVDYLFYPTSCPSEILEQANQIAIKIAEDFKLEGIMAIELFVNQDNQLLVNELSPRPHNSGHHTIEACYTSQYSQLMRCLLDLPLASATLRSSAVVMQNILGADSHTGDVIYEGLEDLPTEGIYLHFYGKKITKPFRKMGHATVLADQLDSAVETAKMLKKTIKVKA